MGMRMRLAVLGRAVMAAETGVGAGAGAGGAPGGALGVLAPPPGAPGPGQGAQTPTIEGQQQQQQQQQPAAFSWDTLGLDKPVAELIAAKAYQSPKDVANAYYHLNRLVSSNGTAPDLIVLPAADAPPEAWNGVYAKLGRPETPAGYELKAPDGKAPDASMVELGQQILHMVGAPASKAPQVAALWNSAVEKMKTEWGTAETNRQVESLNARIAAVGGKEKWDPFVTSGREVFAKLAPVLGNDVMADIEKTIGAGPMVQLLGAIGMNLAKPGGAPKEGQTMQGAGPIDPAQMTPAQAQDAIRQMAADPETQKALWSANHPQHAAVAKRHLDLHAALTRKPGA